MKINLIYFFLALGIAGLLAYGFYNFHPTGGKDVLTLGSFLFFAATLIFAIGVTFAFPRTTTMIRTVSTIFFAIALASNLLFSFFNFSQPLYIIVNGVLLMTYILISYSVQRARQ